jgi:hypothetical protein
MFSPDGKKLLLAVPGGPVTFKYEQVHGGVVRECILPDLETAITDEGIVIEQAISWTTIDEIPTENAWTPAPEVETDTETLWRYDTILWAYYNENNTLQVTRGAIEYEWNREYFDGDVPIGSGETYINCWSGCFDDPDFQCSCQRGDYPSNKAGCRDGTGLYECQTGYYHYWWQWNERQYDFDEKIWRIEIDGKKEVVEYFVREWDNNQYKQNAVTGNGCWSDNCDPWPSLPPLPEDSSTLYQLQHWRKPYSAGGASYLQGTARPGVIYEGFRVDITYHDIDPTTYDLSGDTKLKDCREGFKLAELPNLQESNLADFQWSNAGDTYWGSLWVGPRGWWIPELNCKPWVNDFNKGDLLYWFENGYPVTLPSFIDPDGVDVDAMMPYSFGGS